jgi:hypothetical protein
MKIETLIIIFAIISCLAISYLIFRFIDKTTSPFKKIGFWIISILTSSIVAFILPIVFFFFSFGYYPSEDFNSTLWKQDESKRIELIDDLLNQKLLDNLSKNGVIELLGNPLTNNGYYKTTGRDMIYYLGQERNPFGVDSEWLLIWLENDKVIRYEVWSD